MNRGIVWSGSGHSLYIVIYNQIILKCLAACRANGNYPVTGEQAV